MGLMVDLVLSLSSLNDHEEFREELWKCKSEVHKRGQY